MDISGYERQIFRRGEQNFFVLPWSSIMVRNRDSRGNIFDFKSMRHYKKKKIKKWVLCRLYLFRDTSNNNAVFPVFICDECRFMHSLWNLPLDQRKDDLQRHKCCHSLLCDRIEAQQGGFLNLWPINLNNFGPNDHSYKVQVNINVKYRTLIDDKHLLAAVYNLQKNEISILHNFKKVKLPVCQTCSSRPCKCLR